MIGRNDVFALAFLGALAASALSGQQAAPVADLGPKLEELRATSKVPALAAAVVTADGVVARGASGVRKQGDGTPATVNDLWHIGSITKSFTSMLFARLVEAGKIRFEQTLVEILPEAEGTPYAQVTFEQLLSHRSGMPENPPMTSLVKGRTSKDPLVEQRRQLVAEILASPPVHEKGSAFLYSNAGYVVTGAALERLTATPWEDLVRAQVIVPLDLRSAGFGPPGTAGAVDQPYGHLYPIGAARPPHPIPPGPLADNPPFLGPAGTLHLSIDDLAAYLKDHMNGESGSGALLSAESYRRLHRALGDRYALGWVDDRPDWADSERLVWHNGSNSMWYAMIGFFPDRGLGIVAVSNGGLGSEAVVTRAFQQIAREWRKDPAPSN
ncbi:MAG TPA: serine hydrolase domain-containing protein [Thermoanaerobaculia bacterium]|nr:serine hydrolase domain-containing protein [Thermoanaerobaculia bacterium]